MLEAQGNLLTVMPPASVQVARGGSAETKLDVRLRPGFHVNSSTPADEYLIPLRLTWAPGPLKAIEVIYPKPEARSYSFSQKPLSVYTGNFAITTRFRAESGAPAGPGALTGKLSYQACNENTCFPPKTVEVRLPYNVK
jgi:thiol:disulfide interchange protein DsbD